ncbi:LPXTG cell wall anchor domain-containing protein [Lentzea albida]|uniref:LPXTG-motif cell wall anchor domain-containing protein n=1 Tax=Lentzea albida TaxID=65499 RepID=A0A1H9TVI5_9PSEU|nr:LPXTG cell wall anchor domain-containing protein [Lentzea albida]SES01099.1 LPXTG-motif cell wall anchor domain-containing protein [Lentzea albida]
MRQTPLRRACLASAAFAVAMLALTATAVAQPTTDDSRATAYSGNVDINHKDACTVGGLTGTPIAPGQFTSTGGDGQYLDITGVPAGVKVTGIVVKGGNAYNVYLAGKLGGALPWLDLRSPLNNGGKVPQISHWYGCGIKDTTTTTTTTTTATSTSTSTVTHSSSPSSTTSTTATTTTTTSGEGASTTTTTQAFVPVADEGGLASTGFGSAWLLGLGAALVAAGAAVVLVLRRRRA